eukprot:Rmarinus@m.28979
MRILFVCTSNVCRSPMAEGIAKQWFAERLHTTPDKLPEHGVTVESGALTEMYEPANSPASENSVIAMRKRGIDISKHRSVLLTPEMLKTYDIILGVTSQHARYIESMEAEVADRTYALGEVYDPWHQELEVYESCADELMTLVPNALQKLIPNPMTLSTPQ